MSVVYSYINSLYLIMHRKIYRFANLGTALIQTLDEYVQDGKITSEQKEMILKEYDKVYIYSNCDM